MEVIQKCILEKNVHLICNHCPHEYLDHPLYIFKKWMTTHNSLLQIRPTHPQQIKHIIHTFLELRQSHRGLPHSQAWKLPCCFDLIAQVLFHASPSYLTVVHGPLVSSLDLRIKDRSQKLQCLQKQNTPLWKWKAFWCKNVLYPPIMWPITCTTQLKNKIKIFLGGGLA